MGLTSRKSADFSRSLFPEGIRVLALGRSSRMLSSTGASNCLNFCCGGLPGSAKGRELVRKLFKPGFRQAGIGSVLELHNACPAPRPSRFFQRQGLAFVIDADVERNHLSFFIAPDFGHDCGLGRAHLVAGRGLSP